VRQASFFPSRQILPAVLATLLVACGSSPADPALQGDPSPVASAPAAPVKGDNPEALGFHIEGARAWTLIGNEVTKGHDALELKVTAPEGTRYVDLWLDDAAGVRLERDGVTFRGQVDLRKVEAGEHRILLAADGAGEAFAELAFRRSQPLYVSMTNDWDDPDNGDDKLALQESLHAEHPELVITHFVGPYTFTDPGVTAERAEVLSSWVRKMREDHGDEIGMHIHPWCSFVESAGVECRHEPSFAYKNGGADGDTTGYTVVLGAYSREEMETLLDRGVELFEEHGLGRPTAFRAGGWTMQIHTLEALAAKGFVADGSPANWRRLEEWEGYPGALLYDWVKEHWITINDTSQPYYPSETDILESSEPTVPVLEVPDNGLLVDYVTGQEMIEVFEKNWDGAALVVPRVVSIGYHPPNFSSSYKSRLHTALTHYEQYLASQDRGPVVYVRMSDLAKVFER